MVSTKILGRPVIYGIVTAIMVSSCTFESEPNVISGTRNQILHISNGTEPQGLDPHIITGVPEHHIVSALLEGLVTKNPVTLAPEPGVAEQWNVSDDRRTYTFKLRNNARWSNGDPVTAHDFIYSWKRVLSPALGSQYAYMLFYIRNAEQFYIGTITDFGKTGVSAVDDHTLKVELDNPTPFFLQLLDHPIYFPVHRDTIEKYGAVDDRDGRWTRAGNFTGNGPFILKEWVLNRIIVLEKNPNYWDSGPVRLKEIRFYPIDSITTEERMFRAGQLHATNSVPVQKIESYKNQQPENIRIAPFLGTYFFNINTAVPPLNDARVRRALAMAIDREKIVKNIAKGGQLPAYTLTPLDTNGYTAPAAFAYGVEGARKLLAEAGFPDGKNFPELTLLYNTSEGHRQIATAIQQMWKTALNIDISLENQDWKVYLDNQRTMNYQISRASWIGDYVDPNTFLELYISGGGNNRTGWSNPSYDQLIGRAAATRDQRERYGLFMAAEKILMEEMPVIPIYTYTTVHLISPDVKGWPSNILDHRAYKSIYLSSSGEAAN